MRVVAGKYRGRPLRSLRGMDLRPTADRLRETLFDVLTAGTPAALEGTVWLDLYAGTGAVGIEALSRGAGFVYFVEFSPAADLVCQNLQSLGVVAGFQVVKQEVKRALRWLEAEGTVTDYVFLDPPYRMEEAYRKTLASLARSSVLKAGTVVIAEHQKKYAPGEAFASLRRYRTIEQGDAALSFYRIGVNCG